MQWFPAFTDFLSDLGFTEGVLIILVVLSIAGQSRVITNNWATARRKMAKTLKQYRNTLRQADPLDSTDNPEIQVLYTRVALCLAKGFLAYTPLIRWELVLRLLVVAYQVGKKASKLRIAEYVIGNAEKVCNDARYPGFIEDATVA